MEAKKGKIEVLAGEIFEDHRGVIMSENGLSFEGIERFYTIRNHTTEIVRGWHGHQFERKWFYCLRGAFKMAFVEIDDWDHPSRTLRPEVFHISAKRSEILCVPEGHANCLQAEEPDSLLLVFSGKTYPECLSDSWRYEVDYWGPWEQLE